MRTGNTMAVILITALLLIGCSSNPVTKQQATDSRNLSPAINPTQLTTATVPSGTSANDISSRMVVRDEEAYLLAQWLTGELYTARPLANKIASDLKIIRREFGHSVPESDIRFITRYETGELRIGFTEKGWIEYKAGNYNHWDSLNTAWLVDEIIGSGNDLFKSVTLKFRGLTNVDSLINYYSDLPDLSYVQGNAACCDWPIMLATQSDGRLHYFFRDAWGDCPAGCINSETHYFTIENSHARYHGSYLKDWVNPLPAPAWYEMAVSVLAQYQRY